MKAEPAEVNLEEEVAQALFKADGWVKTLWIDVGSTCKDKYRVLARAAIRVIQSHHPQGSSQKEVEEGK